MVGNELCEGPVRKLEPVGAPGRLCIRNQETHDSSAPRSSGPGPGHQWPERLRFTPSRCEPLAEGASRRKQGAGCPSEAQLREFGAAGARRPEQGSRASSGCPSLGPFLGKQERTSRRARERAQHPRRQPKTADSAAPAQGPRQRSSTGTSSPFACKQAPATGYPQTDPTPNTSAATISASTSPNQGFAMCGWSDQAPRL